MKVFSCCAGRVGGGLKVFKKNYLVVALGTLLQIIDFFKKRWRNLGVKLILLHRQQYRSKALNTIMLNCRRTFFIDNPRQ